MGPEASHVNFVAPTEINMVRTEDRPTEYFRKEMSDDIDAAGRYERRHAADYAAAFGRDAFDWSEPPATPLRAAPDAV